MAANPSGKIGLMEQFQWQMRSAGMCGVSTATHFFLLLPARLPMLALLSPALWAYAGGRNWSVSTDTGSLAPGTSSLHAADRFANFGLKQFLVAKCSVFLSGYCCKPRKKNKSMPKATPSKAEPPPQQILLAETESSLLLGSDLKRNRRNFHPPDSVFWLQGLKKNVTIFGHRQIYSNTVAFWVAYDTSP